MTDGMRGALLGFAIACGASVGQGCGEPGAPLDAGLDGGPRDAGVPIDAPLVPRDGGPYAPGDAGMPGELAGCEGATLLAVPDEPELPGPWPVGARTVQVGRLTAEVWYPADPASVSGSTAIVYDLRHWLPPSQVPAIPDDDNPWQRCDCARDLAIDAAHGPYPVVVFVHGTAAFRTQSLSFMTHWASRGFVVVAADHPGLFLGDALATLGGCPDDPTGEQDLAGDVAALLEALRAPAGDLAFLEGRIDADRVGLSGHSAGGVVASLTELPGVRVIASMAGAQQAVASSSLESSLFVAATADRVVPYMRSLDAYGASPTPRRFLGIENSGHLAPSDLCDLVNADGQNMIEVATEHRICGATLGRALFDCRDDHVAPPIARAGVAAITTAVLEEVLTCRDRSAAIAAIPTRLESIAELRQE